jgi:hypothetical protein
MSTQDALKIVWNAMKETPKEMFSPLIAAWQQMEENAQPKDLQYKGTKKDNSPEKCTNKS